MGVSARPTQRRPGHQFPLGREPLSKGALPRSGQPLLRVHGQQAAKSKWKFRKAGEDWFCFAGLWRPMPDGAGDAFTLLTTEPGPDVAPIHDRQMVVLDRSDWQAWLLAERPEAELLRPLPAGSLTVKQVR